MLATLERPIGRPISPSFTPSVIPSVSSPRAPARLTLLAPAPASPARSLHVLSPVLPAVVGPQVGPIRSSAPLRMTVRARRLLAGLVLVCCAAVGVVAVDLLSSVVPFAPSASYAAQVAPYVGSNGGSAGSGGLLPSSGSSITVGIGDTLWSVAERVDPDADPREVIAAIMTLNDLSSPTLQPGQVLRLP